jgi:beta-xylosidase
LGLLALTQGASVKIIDTGNVAGRAFYVNDHTLVKAADGSWRLYGIYHEEPFNSGSEDQFLHAESKKLEGPFTASAQPALKKDKGQGEFHLWAPHVVQDGSRWVMAYQAGGPDNDRAKIAFAQSTDLKHWTRTGTSFEDICVARDPMMFKAWGLWVLYYTRCDSKEGRHSGVAYRTSYDLNTWSEPRMALVLEHTPPMFNSGYTESPFVFEKDGWFYLSVTSYPVEWDATFLFRSKSPYSFKGPPVARLRAHAAEWIVEGGQLFMTHCGAGQKGVYISQVDGL